MSPHDPPEDPESPPHPDEIDIDLTTDADEPAPESLEFMGEADSLEQFFRRQLEDFIHPSVLWLLDHIDWHAVQRRMEGTTYRYIFDPHGVHRVRRTPPAT